MQYRETPVPQLVLQPHKSTAPGTTTGHMVAMRKADDELQMVWGEVYAPNFPDSQGDFMTPDTIRKMAHDFMKSGNLDSVDTNHDQKKNGSLVVESFIARDNDPDFIPGSWVVGIHIPEPTVWQLVKSGELNGFSMEGRGVRVDKEIEVYMPELLTGETMAHDDGHIHSFYVKFDDNGKFLGGYTGPGPDGHSHVITKGTRTDDASGHTHRFSFVEGVMHAQSAA